MPPSLTETSGTTSLSEAVETGIRNAIDPIARKPGLVAEMVVEGRRSEKSVLVYRTAGSEFKEHHQSSAVGRTRAIGTLPSAISQRVQELSIVACCPPPEMTSWNVMLLGLTLV